MPLTWTRSRRDLLLVTGLGAAIALSWSLEYGFFGEQRFSDPLSYRGDALLTAAAISEGRRGDLVPFASKMMPSLGAPFVASWNDFPITEDWLIWLIGLLARLTDTIVAINLGYVGAMVLSGASMFYVARRFGLRRESAVLAGFLFGLSNYAFVRTVHHYSLTFCWMVPWNVLVGAWLSSRRGIPFKSARFAIAAVTTVITAWGFVYYSFFAAQLYVLGTLAGLLRNRRKTKLKPIFALAGLFAVALLAVNLDSVLYARANGINEAALARSPTDVELYALKPINFFVPAHLHRFAFMRELYKHAAEQTMIGGEHPGPYLGMFGGASLLALGLYAMWGFSRGKADRAVAWGGTAGWLIIAHSVGGLNSAMGLFGFRLFRSVNRVSVVVLAVVLLFGAWLVGRALRRLPRPARWAAVVTLALLAGYEQVPMTDPNETVARNRRLADSDRKLTAQLESALAPGAMVFQLPVMHFPEVPPHYGVDGYEFFRPTFFAKTLRFSHGDVKGRPNADWKFRVASQPPPQMVAELRAAGFAAIYINRKGFPDGGAGLIQGLQAAGCRVLAVGDAGDTLALAL